MEEQQPKEQLPESAEEQAPTSTPLTKILIGIIAGLVVIFAIGVGAYFFTIQNGDFSPENVNQQIENVSLSCEVDSDCVLADTSHNYDSCWAGACDEIDYSLDAYTAVNAESFSAFIQDRYKECGSAPRCPSTVINNDFSAVCVQNLCKKIAAISPITIDTTPGPDETDSERLARMLAPFDIPDNYVQGRLFVSFTPTISKSGAENILEKYQLSVDRWDSELVGAHVDVPEGEEQQLAQTLVQEEDIIWVEPERFVTTF